MKVKEMNKENVTKLTGAAEVALTEVAERYGVTLTRENGTYDSHAGIFHSKWTFTVPTASGVPANFSSVAWRFGLTDADYNGLFTTHNGTFRLVAIKTRNRKYPIIGERVTDGKRYKCSKHVLTTLKRAA